MIKMLSTLIILLMAALPHSLFVAGEKRPLAAVLSTDCGAGTDDQWALRDWAIPSISLKKEKVREFLAFSPASCSKILLKIREFPRVYL
jgi:hypothetical protein